MNIKFDSEPVYGDNDKYIKTKIKPYGDKINTNFPEKNTTGKCIHYIIIMDASYNYIVICMFIL